MARLELAPRAVAELDHFIDTYSLPPDTKERVRRVVRPLADFPLMGARPGPDYRLARSAFEVSIEISERCRR